MDTSTRYPTVAATTIASAHIGSRNLSTNPKRMAFIKAWVLLKKNRSRTPIRRPTGLNDFN